jgi:L-ascorbate metabolism protein UlaG (beta-lactamase superfamily)
MKKIATILFAAALLLAACGQPADTNAPTTAPTLMPTSAGTMLTYGDNAQVELVTPTGRHIYIDVFSPGMLTKDPSKDDILLTTHLHDDHYKAIFVKGFPGQQIYNSTGKIELPDVTITGLAAGHNAGDPLLDKGGTDYIFVIETGGLRIVHFGDIGQDALTSEQLTAIGSVDVAVMQFSNGYSNMDATNLKGFNLMDQVKPRLIIPTHSDSDATKIAIEKWKGWYSESRTMVLSAGSLPSEASILFLGSGATSYGSIYKLPLWK